MRSHAPNGTGFTVQQDIVCHKERYCLKIIFVKILSHAQNDTVGLNASKTVKAEECWVICMFGCDLLLLWQFLPRGHMLF